MNALARNAPVDLDAFLAWEEQQHERFELAGGVVRMMAGGSVDHDRITRNIVMAVEGRLRGGPCEAQGPSLKIVSRASDTVMYPDVLVRCGPISGRGTSIDDPVIVVEVLSDSTARYDMGRKRMAYEAISSLRRIVYVTVTEARIEMRARGADGLWRDDLPVEGLEGAMGLTEVDIAVPMAEIYARTDLAITVSAP